MKREGLVQRDTADDAASRSQSGTVARPGTKLLYKLQDGEDYRFFAGRVIVVHPERPPKVITSDGAIEYLGPLP